MTKTNDERVAQLDRVALAAAEAIIERIRSGTMTSEQKSRLVGRIVSALKTMGAVNGTGTVDGSGHERAFA